MTDLLVDTSVAVPLLLTSHAAHRSVNAAVGARSVALAGHAAHETFAVLTRLPGDARLAPLDAVRLLRERFEAAVVLDARSSRAALATLAELDIAGGATYDGLIALAARSSGLPLGSRDRRAEGTYRRLGVEVELLPGR
jgi:toxin FitB